MSGYSIPRKRVPSRPKCELQSSIEIRSKNRVYGQNTFGSRIGFASQNLTFEIMSVFIIISLFLSSFTFNSENKNITVGSHNLHGFKTSSEYHKSCISNYGGIWFCQEHWLSNKQLPQLQKLNAQFVARSGMEDAVSHGGVSISWSRDLDHVITPLSDYKHKRVVAVKLTTTNESIIFVSVYMPFLDSRKREMCRAETVETIGMIETIIEDHPNHLFVIGGDFNCELNGGSPFDGNWNNLTSRNRLAYCSHLFSSPGYTYHHESLGQRKFNDHFIVSQEIFDRAICSNHKILEDGQNPSDHLPISMIMNVEIQPCVHKSDETSTAPTLKWSKVSDNDKIRYQECLQSCLSTVESVLDSFPCKCNSHCESELCKTALQFEYDFLMDSMEAADKLLPRHSKGREKHWWSTELSALKRQSIQIQNLWITEGRPGQGPTHLERLRVRAAYRRALKDAQKKPKQDSWNKLHTAMETCNTSDFWHSWKLVTLRISGTHGNHSTTKIAADLLL